MGATRASRRPAVLSLLDWIGRRGSWCLAGGVGAGLLLPDLAAALRPGLPAIIVFTLTMSLLRLDFRLVRRYVGRPVLLGWASLVMLAATPLLAWAVFRLAPLPDRLGEAVVLMALAPPITSSPAFALLVGLEAEFAVAAVLATHALAPLTLPPLALALLGLTIPLSLPGLALRLGAIVAIAFVLAAVLKAVLRPAWLARQAPRLDGLTVAGLVCFAIAVMAGATEVLLARPGFFALVLLVSILANLALQVVGTALAWRAGPRIALTVGFMAGNCNMGLVLAALGPEAGPVVSVYFALAQIPMYLMPLLAGPLYRRLGRAQGPSDSTMRAS